MAINSPSSTTILRYPNILRFCSSTLRKGRCPTGMETLPLFEVFSGFSEFLSFPIATSTMKALKKGFESIIQQNPALITYVRAYVLILYQRPILKLQI